MVQPFRNLMVGEAGQFTTVQSIHSDVNPKTPWSKLPSLLFQLSFPPPTSRPRSAYFAEEDWNITMDKILH